MLSLKKKKSNLFLTLSFFAIHNQGMRILLLFLPKTKKKEKKIVAKNFGPTRAQKKKLSMCKNSFFFHNDKSIK